MTALHGASRSVWFYFILGFFFSIVGVNHLSRNITRLAWVIAVTLVTTVIWLTGGRIFCACLLILNVLWLGLAEPRGRTLVTIAIILLSIFCAKEYGSIPGVQGLLALYIFVCLCL